MGLLDAPPLPLIKRAVSAGYAPTIVTDTQRQALTPAIGDVILTSDTLTYWTGDGATVGGVASPTGLSTSQAVRLNLIQPRCHDLLARVRSTAVGLHGTAVGNSIVQGTGASSAGAAWVYQLSTQLQAETGVGVTNDWTFLNYGVGGSQITVPLGYVADLLGTDGIVTASTDRLAKYPFGVLMTMRNDTATSAGLWNQRMRACIRAMLAICEDVVIVSEPPQLGSNGAPIDSTGWATLTRITQEVAADYGCTYVDVWGKWMLEYQAGADLTLRMAETSGTRTHPNDAGHVMIAKFVMQAFLTPVSQRPGAIRDRAASGVGQLAMPISSHIPVVADVAASTVAGGFVTAYTARGRHVGSNQAYSVTSGQTMRFDCPLPIYRVRPVVVQGNSAGGSMTLDGVSLGTFSSSAGSQLELPATTFTPATTTPGVIVVSGTNANGLKVLGVQYDTPQALDQHPTWPGGTESGTWSGASFAATGAVSGTAVRSSATVGDYIDITWYGIYLCWALETGSNRGQVTEVTDGGSATTHDGYTTTGSYLYRCTPAMALGWHTTRLTVATKNASSSANTVTIGAYKTCVAPDASLAYVAMAQGETMQLHGRWRLAAVDRALSGSPYVAAWTPGSPTLTLAGTGGAIVRLER